MVLIKKSNYLDLYFVTQTKCYYVSEALQAHLLTHSTPII